VRRERGSLAWQYIHMPVLTAVVRCASSLASLPRTHSLRVVAVARRRGSSQLSEGGRPFFAEAT
jgi:hypothetical protein